jgi:hypothetical protein
VAQNHAPIGICKDCKWLGTDLFRTMLLCNHSSIIVDTSHNPWTDITTNNVSIPTTVDMVRKNETSCQYKNQ